jgi:hypothetical protein
MSVELCLEALAAAVVANLPTIYGLRRPNPNCSANANSTTGSRGGRPLYNTAAADSEQIPDKGILVTRSVELRSLRSGTPFNGHEYLHDWNKNSSKESLVHVSLFYHR